MKFRRALLVFSVAVFVALAATQLFAQERWPAYPLDDVGADWRGPGGYLSWLKLASYWVVFLSWVATSDWANRDMQAHGKVDQGRWNAVIFGAFIGAFILVLLLPLLYWVGLAILIVVHWACLISYIVYRNSKVGAHERVLTPSHIRFWLSQRLTPLGIKLSAERVDAREGGPLKLLPRSGGSQQDDNVRLLAARQSSGFITAGQILADALAVRATAVMLDFTQQSVAVNYMVDGVWLNQDAMQREAADPALEALKLLSGLNAQDRKSRQEGPFTAEMEKIRYLGTLTSQGTATGERAVVQLDEKKVRFTTLDDLGMRPKMQEQLLELLATKQGYMLFSALPANGLRSTLSVALRVTDRMTREFATMESETNRYEEIENIPVMTYKPGEEPTPLVVVQKLLRTEPHAVLVRDVPDAETAAALCDAVGNNKLIISTFRAKDSAEALLRMLALGVPAASFAKVVTAVVSQRLVRKLCETCKEAYAPTPEVLKQLGIPAGRVQAFYRPPQPGPDERKKICRDCNGLGYYGRTAIFEVLPVGETVRKVLAASPKLDLLRSAARRDGMRSLQEEGILLVARGVTSLPELMRVLKQ
jgi:type II secretory ATPase GspE/PulE/Tfp pilus assembly ATPase PilB-like protein